MILIKGFSENSFKDMFPETGRKAVDEFLYNVGGYLDIGRCGNADLRRFAGHHAEFAEIGCPDEKRLALALEVIGNHAYAVGKWQDDCDEYRNDMFYLGLRVGQKRPGSDLVLSVVSAHREDADCHEETLGEISEGEFIDRDAFHERLIGFLDSRVERQREFPGM